MSLRAVTSATLIRANGSSAVASSIGRKQPLLCGAMTNAQSSEPGGRKKPEKEGCPLWGVVLLGTSLSAAVGYLLAAALARLVAGSGTWWDVRSVQLTSSQWYDVLRSDIAAFGLAAAGGAAFLAYRRQRTSEGGHRLERERHDLTERVDFRDRYVKAVEQLGHDKPAVRLGGVYAMAQLADDWGLIDVAQRQVCIDVLCAYFRMPYDPEKAEPGEEQVRLTVISVIRQHLQDPDTLTSWCRADLDFTGAAFTGKESFTGVKFSGGEVSFAGAVFGGRVPFVVAVFSGGTVSFEGAEFSGGEVAFIVAVFSGSTVAFEGAMFSGGIVSFAGAKFSGGEVAFDGAVFSGGNVSFNGAEFSGGDVSFYEAVFSGGAVNFAGVRDWSRPPDGLPGSPPPGLTLPLPPGPADETA